MKTQYVLALHPNFTVASKGGLLFVQSKIFLITFSDMLFVQMTKNNEISFKIYFKPLVN